SLLHDFGFAKGDFAEADFTVPEQMIQLGRAPNRIDLLTSISGVLIEDAFRTKIFTEMEGLPVFILNKELLIQNKRAVEHPQAVEYLEGREDKTPVSAGETPAIITQIRQISEWQAALTINY